MLTVVVGPPCAGKSTYIRRMARSGDVLIDYDALARALGSDRAHEAPPNVADAAYFARQVGAELPALAEYLRLLGKPVQTA